MIWIRAAVLLLLATLAVAASASNRFGPGGMFPQMETTAIAYDQRGVLWWGTSDELIRFDGHRVVPVVLEVYSAVQDRGIRALLATPTGMLVATANDLRHMDRLGQRQTRILAEGQSLGGIVALVWQRDTALAVTDLAKMVVYVPNAAYFYCFSAPVSDSHHRYGWIVYLLFTQAFTITAHTVAIWLTVSIAVFRYIVVCGRHSLGARLCSRKRAKLAVAAVVITTVIFCVPNYVMYHPEVYNPHDRTEVDALNGESSTVDVSCPSPTSFKSVAGESSFRITTSLPESVFQMPGEIVNSSRYHPRGGADVSRDEETSYTSYWFQQNSFVTENYRIATFWLFGIAMKIVPCIVLTVLSALLVQAMRVADARRRRLLTAGRRAESDRAGEHNRTTAMLVVVVLCFVAVEMPQGVLAFLGGIDQRIFDEIYAPLGDFWDMLVLVNSSVNFIVYCTMNRRFRHTAVECFGIDRWFVGRLFCGGSRGDGALAEGDCGGAALVETAPEPTILHPGRVVRQCPNLPLYNAAEHQTIYSRM